MSGGYERAAARARARRLRRLAALDRLVRRHPACGAWVMDGRPHDCPAERARRG